MTDNLFETLLALCETNPQKDILVALFEDESGKGITRNRCAEILRTDDRKARRVIMSMRQAGIPIASTSSRSGYYIPRTMAEYLDFAKAYKSKARTIYDIEKKMNSTFFSIYSGQIEVEEDGKIHNITQ